MKVKLKEICQIEKGKQIDTSKLNNDNSYKYINGGIKESGFYSEYNTEGETILVSEGGASCGYVNYISEKFWCGCHCYRLTNCVYYPKYIYYALKGNQDKIMALRTGAAMPNIKKTTFQDLEIKVNENIEHQQRIAIELDTIQSTIDNKQQQLKELGELVKSRFIEMFGENPVESGKWKVETLEDVCSSIVRGPFGSSLKKDFFVPKSNNTVKVYEQKHAIQKSAEIGTYYITNEKYEELKRFECKSGDFLMSCSGTMGEFYQLPNGCEKGIINQALCKFTLNSKLNPVLFLEWMKHSILNLETKGSGIKNVAAVSFIKKMPMFIPSKDVQNSFANFVQQIDKSKFVVKQQIKDLQELMDSKMQEYFGE